MAEDTRQKASPPPSAPREVSHALSRETQPSASRWHGYFYPPTKPPDSGSITAQAQGDTPPPINVMPGGTANTAGGEKIEDYSFWDVFKSVRPQEFQYLHTLPCVRDSFLIGIPSGIVALGVGIVLRKPVFRACQYGAGTFMAASYITYEHCQWQRRREKHGVKRAVEVMSAKQMEKEKLKEEARQKRRQGREDKDRAEEEARLEQERRRKQWWRLW